MKQYYFMNVNKILFNILKPVMLWLLIGAFILSCSKKASTGSGGSNGGGGTPIPVYDAQVTILAAENNQVIRGFGCATVFAPPATTALTPEEFDRLFGIANGQVGLNFLRIRIIAP